MLLCMELRPLSDTEILVLVRLHVQHVKAIQQEEEKAMAELFEEPRQKAAELVGEAVKEWSSLSQELLADVPTTMEERCPGILRV